MKLFKNQAIKSLFSKMAAVQSVLFAFMLNQASYLERSPLKRSPRYVFSGDRPTCLARLTLNRKPFMNYPG